MSAGLEMALWASARGAKVIPAYINKDLQKMPLLKGWQNNGSRDEEVIRGWYDIRPWACAGVLGGRDSWAVFDCDGREAVEGFRALCTGVSGIDWSKVLVYRTPGRKDADGSGGGLHAMWRYPEWLGELHKAEIRREGWRGNLEFRGKNTWTLLPCNRRDGEYEVVNAPDELDELPRELWLAFAAEAEQTVIGSGDGNIRSMSEEEVWAGAPYSDGRRTILAGLAWNLFMKRYTEDEVLEIAYRFSSECCVEPMDENAIRHIVRYASGRSIKIIESQDIEAEMWVNSLKKIFG